MTSIGKEWLFIIVFFAGFLAISVGESLWLTKTKGVVPKRAGKFVLVPNFIIITAGLFVSFILMIAVMMLAWDGTLSNMRSPDLFAGALIAIAILFPIILMVVIRRLLFRLLCGEGSSVPQSPWLYSILSTLAFFVVTFVPPILVLVF